MQLQVAALKQKTRAPSSSKDEQKAIIDKLVNQAAFATSASLEARIESMRSAIEVKGEQVEWETFVRGLEQLTTLVNDQRTVLDSKASFFILFCL